MALFGTKKNTKTEPVKAVTLSIPTKTFSHKTVIIRPRITEKASLKAEKENVYVFEIAQDANKRDVMKAVKEMYNVSPVAVRVAKNPAKTVFIRGKFGKTVSVKKAYVELKKGDKIELM